MKLFSLGIALFSLFCYSCMDDRLEPIPREELQAIPFSVNDAREFFENNATDLSPLSFTGISVARSTGRANVELNPEWDNAMVSGHKGVTLIEIPLYSTSTVLVQEGIFKNKRLVGTRTTISGRRLIVAKRANGEVDMFVATIVPEARSMEDDLSKMLKDFRYLGGGSFSGKVFCSTLEGKFVKAFGYTDGKLNGTLNTRIRQASGENHAGDEEYSRLSFSETSSTRASMFSGNESGGGGIDHGKCQHGYTKGFCPYGCSAGVDEVDVIVCRYCGTRDGCVCSRCFYCGNKEPECSCTRCTICHKKMPDCRCYEYPDPDKPINPPGGGGGGTTTSPSMSDKTAALFKKNGLGDDIKKFNELMDELVRDCAYKAIFEYLKTKTPFEEVKYDPNMGEGTQFAGASAAANNSSLKFKDKESMNIESLRHEIFHMYQYRYFGVSNLTQNRHMVEFEERIYEDIAAFVRYGGNEEVALESGHAFYCIYPGLSTYEKEYYAFLKKITINGAKYGTLTKEEFYHWANIFGKTSRTYPETSYDYAVPYEPSINDLLQSIEQVCN